MSALDALTFGDAEPSAPIAGEARIAAAILAHLRAHPSTYAHFAEVAAVAATGCKRLEADRVFHRLRENGRIVGGVGEMWRTA